MKVLHDDTRWFVQDERGAILAGPMSSMAAKAFAEDCAQKDRYCEVWSQRTRIEAKCVRRYEP